MDPDRRKPSTEISVFLNNDLLVRNKEYFWLPGRLVLMSDRPSVPPRTLWERAKLLLTLHWDELTRNRVPYPDLVVVENWGMGNRDVYLFGTPEFDAHICYEEDL